MSEKTNWLTVPLKSITTKIGSGATPRGGKESYQQSGISLIRSLNVYDFSFEISDLAFINEQQADQLKNVDVQRDDILLNITGASVARCCIVPSRLLPARVNQHVAIIRCNTAKANPQFILYVINSPYYKRNLLTFAQGGATREALTKQTIEDFEIPLPPLSIQHRIASILSAYDDLIENNTRRIAILEEMARRIYEEWFVQFRFPGHEHGRMVVSELGKIPEGWEVCSLTQIAEVNARSLQKKDTPKEITYIDISSVSTSTINQKELMLFSEAPGRARRIVKDGDIIWSCVRPNRKSYAIILNPELNLIVSTGFAVLSATKVPSPYLYFTVTTNDFVSYLTNRATGAAYPAVAAKDFELAKLLKPPASLLNNFRKLVEPMLYLENSFHQKNANLRTTRNFLLPKLISGEIDVAEFPEPEDIGA